MEFTQLFNDREKEQLNRFAKDDILRELVKKVVLSAVYHEGTLNSDNPLENFALAFAAGAAGPHGKLTKEEIGEKLESSLIAVQLINDGFARLQRFNKKKEAQKEEVTNQAR
ncbi:hypothetical protein H8E77_37870 [bacterium]|nr:hypothetical protein [bacterium]